MHPEAVNAMRQRFALPSAAPADPLGLFVHRMRLGLAPLTGWSASSIRRRDRPLGSVHTTLWNAPGCVVRIDCREEPSRQAAHDALPEALGHVASPELARLPPQHLVGEVAFAAPAGVIFRRANLLFGVMVLAGPPTTWRYVAAALDDWLSRLPAPSALRALAATTVRVVRPGENLRVLEEDGDDAMVRIFAPGLEVERTSGGLTCSAPDSGSYGLGLYRETAAGATAAEQVVQVTE